MSMMDSLISSGHSRIMKPCLSVRENTVDLSEVGEVEITMSAMLRTFGSCDPKRVMQLPPTASLNWWKVIRTMNFRKT